MNTSRKPRRPPPTPQEIQRRHDEDVAYGHRLFVENYFSDGFAASGEGLALAAHYPSARDQYVIEALACRPATLTLIAAVLAPKNSSPLTFVDKDGRWCLGEARGSGIASGLSRLTGMSEAAAARRAFVAIGRGIAMGVMFGVEHASEVLRLPGATP